MKCPFITDPKKIERTFNKAINYKDLGGNEDYIFFDHIDHNIVTRVQFCELIGRKRNIFECLNEEEWKKCYAYRMKIKNGGKGGS